MVGPDSCLRSQLYRATNRGPRLVARYAPTTYYAPATRSKTFLAPLQPAAGSAGTLGASGCAGSPLLAGCLEDGTYLVLAPSARVWRSRGFVEAPSNRAAALGLRRSPVESESKQAASRAAQTGASRRPLGAATAAALEGLHVRFPCSSGCRQVGRAAPPSLPERGGPPVPALHRPGEEQERLVRQGVLPQVPACL